MRLSGPTHCIVAAVLGFVAQSYLTWLFEIPIRDTLAWHSLVRYGSWAVIYFGVLYAPRLWVKQARS